jgi:guanyl-specific ribonuclease Sa
MLALRLGLCLFLATASLSHAQTQAPANSLPKTAQNVPTKVLKVLESLDETGKAPANIQGGRVYDNDGSSGSKILPRQNRDGDSIVYQTWDVNPKTVRSDRGQERLVIGSDGSAYYTDNYYKSFSTIRNPSRSSVQASKPKPPASGASQRNNSREKPIVSLPPKTAAKVMPVVDHILSHDAPPVDTVGGRDYRNLGLEDGEVLPRTDTKGKPIRYREWDVNKKVAGRNRGAERIVTGTDGRVYYTSDHYSTFQRIK